MKPLPNDTDAAIAFLKANGYRKPAALLAMFASFQDMAEQLQLQPAKDLKGAQMNLSVMLGELGKAEESAQPVIRVPFDVIEQFSGDPERLGQSVIDEWAQVCHEVSSKVEVPLSLEAHSQGMISALTKGNEPMLADMTCADLLKEKQRKRNGA